MKDHIDTLNSKITIIKNDIVDLEKTLLIHKDNLQEILNTLDHKKYTDKVYIERKQKKFELIEKEVVIKLNIYEYLKKTLNNYENILIYIEKETEKTNNSSETSSTANSLDFNLIETAESLNDIFSYETDNNWEIKLLEDKISRKESELSIENQLINLYDVNYLKANEKAMEFWQKTQTKALTNFLLKESETAKDEFSSFAERKFLLKKMKQSSRKIFNLKACIQDLKTELQHLNFIFRDEKQALDNIEKQALYKLNQNQNKKDFLTALKFEIEKINTAVSKKITTNSNASKQHTEQSKLKETNNSIAELDLINVFTTF